VESDAFGARFCDSAPTGKKNSPCRRPEWACRRGYARRQFKQGEYQAEQERDEYCMKQNPGALSMNREFFRDDDGVMYRRRPQGKHQVVVPRSLIQRVLNQNHNQKYIAHPGVK